MRVYQNNNHIENISLYNSKKVVPEMELLESTFHLVRDSIRIEKHQNVCKDYTTAIDTFVNLVKYLFVNVNRRDTVWILSCIFVETVAHEILKQFELCIYQWKFVAPEIFAKNVKLVHVWVPIRKDLEAQIFKGLMTAIYKWQRNLDHKTRTNHQENIIHTISNYFTYLIPSPGLIFSYFLFVHKFWVASHF